MTDEWVFEPATDSDIGQLMLWFPDQRSLNTWGGPHFRYPFTRETFCEDARWTQMAAYCLRDATGGLLGFGQFYERYKRINLARLVVHADARGQGVGKRLISGLMTVARPLFDLNEFSLFVYRDNTPALECYKALGFEIQDYPDDMPLADACYYLTRAVDQEE